MRLAWVHYDPERIADRKGPSVTNQQPPSAPGYPDPWSQPQDAGLAAPTPDMFASPAPATLQSGRRRRTPLIVVAVATVVALLLGGGAYAGLRMWNGSGSQPEQATPSTVLAFVRLDLSPGYGQKLKVNNLFKKFPDANGKDPAEELKQGIFDALDVDEATYRKHVEPWFADRIGVGLWLDDAKRPYGLIVLAVDDESAARAGLAELRRAAGDDQLGFAVRDGYALVAKGEQGAQEAARAAGEELATESLADSPEFRDDVESLPARQTALAWADLGKAGEALTAAMGDLDRGADPDSPAPASPGDAFLQPGMRLGGLAGLPFGGIPGGLKGRMVIGAQATDGGVDVRFRVVGSDAAVPADGAARSAVDALPGDSLIAGSTKVGELGDAWRGLLPGLDPGLALPEELLKELPPDEAEQARKEMQDSRKQVEAIGKAVEAVSGATIDLAITGVKGDVPALGASAQTSSAGDAAALAEALRQVGDEVTVSTSGTKVELKTEGYAPGGGTLGSQALYRQTLDGAPDNASTVLYLDMQRLVTKAGMTDKERRQVQAVKAIGLATGAEDGDIVGLLRVVIK
jgi:hypothetical protein